MTLKLRLSFVTLLLMMLTVPGWAVNTKTTVEQVTSTVTLSTDVDYIITSATPFSGTDAIVNITNTDHAVLILDAVRPSKAISSWLKYVQINGQKAVNNTNCQVKIYNLGCIILPYPDGDNFKPLTVYSEKNFEGESCNDFGLENTGGYMNTLTDEKLNNRISSFKLKRGYMVTFALKDGGRGYSRCFIAADKDIEMASMPGILDNSISSYRVFKWYDCGKKQLANYMDKTALTTLNVQSSYDWAQGNSSFLPDFEWVPNHIYEDYPSSSTIGKTMQSPHTKNNNEPRNSSDDHPQDLTTILNNWENMMRTGLRLCSPASWDGSDYSNATGFLAEFLDSIDARGWRCDIIDLHCYWAEGTFGNIHNWSDKYKRPIWISEWCWGASWNNNGAFASGVTEQQVKEALERICGRMNGWDYVERYYYWNGERDPSRLYKNGSLTPAGQYYASMNSGLGYNGKYDYAPKVPTQYDPSDLSVLYNSTTGSAQLKWNDRNGEMNVSMSVERRSGIGKTWEKIADIELQESKAAYTYEDNGATNGCQYRVHIVDGKSVDRYTKVVTAVNNDYKAGDAIDVNGTTMYLGGNMFTNGNFDMGFLGWKNGLGEEPAAPYFQVVKAGGYDDGTYLQAYGTGTQSTAMSINTILPIETNTYYYFSAASSYMSSSNASRLGLSKEGSISNLAKVYLNNTSPNWNMHNGTFNSDSYTEARLLLYNMEAKGQVDQLLLSRLFESREEAIADGVAKMREKAAMFIQYNTKQTDKFPALNTELTQTLAAVTTTDEAALTTLTTAVDNAIKAYRILESNERGDILAYAEKLAAFNLVGVEDLREKLAAAQQAVSAAEIVSTYPELDIATDVYLPQTDVEDLVKNPSFDSSIGWTTKCGTYTQGDQRINSTDETTFWNAFWSGVDATDETQTMAIKQSVNYLSHGLYALECKASTEHYCLSDQHGYITDGTQTENTPLLSADFFDLPAMSKKNRWQTLLSAPIYVDENSDVTIGFEGSKKGALSNAWIERGKTSGQTNDKREGWWCATDFTLKHTPLYQLTVVPEQCGAICLPYALHPQTTMKYYQIVGINPEYTQLCLAEVEQPEAGVPYIYRSTVADARFLEFGTPVSKVATEEQCNLRGFLSTSARVPANYFYVKDGAFEKAPSANRPSIGNFTGILRPFSDNKATGIPVIENWEGQTMPINGVTDADKTANEAKVSTGIHYVAVKTKAADGIYTVDGRSVSPQSMKPGLYIKVVDGRAYKTVVK